MIGAALLRWFVGPDPDWVDSQVRKRIGLLEGWASVVVNLTVFAVKLVPGILIGSVSLVADAFHSLSDVVTSVVVIWGFRAAAKPPDREHPFGHGRVESVASLVVALLLLVAAVEFVRTAIGGLLHPRSVSASLPLLAVLVITIVLKEWLARFSARLGRHIGSVTLEADSWHHRSDALSTGVVVLALAGERLGWRRLDAIGGLVVAGFIVAAGIQLVRRSLGPLIGEAPSTKLQKRIRQLAVGVRDVEAVHDVLVHSYGPLLVISLHVELPAEIDVVRAHDIAEEVERLLGERLGAVVVAHVDPIDRNHPLYAPVSGFLAELSSVTEGVKEFHDLRFVGGEYACNVVFDLALEDVDSEPIVQHYRQAILDQFPQVKAVVIEIEPTLVY
ncbi:MAG: cation diffusion facilitator family transporter [Acidobacteria bacterium]|nr:cation diffusion facilitator family transporter [Acidobacteriota bacterium]